jgi:glycosyltransferase involved in cell wall biosynthesis
LGAEPRSDIQAPGRISKPSHLVFFGRLEERKGINIFLEALASEELKSFRFRLTFLGREATRSVDEIRAFVAEHRPDLTATLDLQPYLTSDEAQAFLAATDCVAVIPSLIDNSPCVVYECLKHGQAFIAAGSGGIPELIHAEDRDLYLFDPTASGLIAKLRDVLSSESWKAPRPSYDPSDIGGQWLAWFDEQTASGPRANRPIETPPSKPPSSKPPSS